MKSKVVRIPITPEDRVKEILINVPKVELPEILVTPNKSKKLKKFIFVKI